MPQPPPDPLYVLRGHRAAVQCVAFLPNCKSLAAGDAEGELKLWDLDSQRPTASIRAHDSTSGILQVACPTTHPWLLSQGRDGVVKCWGLHSDGSGFSSEPLQQLSTGCYNFCRFALLEPGQTSSSCCRGPTSQHHHHQQQPGTASIAPHPAQPPPKTRLDGFAAMGEPAGGVSLQGSGEGLGSRRQQAAPTAEGLLSQQLKQHQEQQQQSSRHTAQQVQHPHQQQQQQQACARMQVSGLQLLDQEGVPSSQGAAPHHTAAGTAAVPADADDLTEAAEEQLVTRASAAHSSSSSQADNTTAVDSSSSAGPCYLALPAEDPAHLGVWQLGAAAAAAGGGGSGDGQRPHMLLAQSKGPQQPHRGQVMAVVLLQPAGLPLHALTGYEDGSVALWDSRNSSTFLAAQKLHSEPVMCLAAAPDCSSGFSGAADDKLATFDVDIPKGQLRAGPQLALPQQGLADVAVRPDGRVAATAGWDCKVRVWHARRRQPLAVLKWHSQQVACVGFSGDGVLMAAGGRDNFISMWSLYPPQ